MAIGAAAAAARRAQLASTIAPAPQKQERGGLFGTGIGPDIDLGITTAAKEFATGISALPRLVTSIAPGGEKSQLPGLGRGLASSILGTAKSLDPTSALTLYLGSMTSTLAGAVYW